VRQTVFDGQSQEPPPTIKTEPSRSAVAERLAEAHQLVARKKACKDNWAAQAALVGASRLTLWFPLARRKSICYKLNHMVQYNETRLDASFAALSDATRRGVLEQLSRADASITDLAGKFHMTLTGMKKHVAVLERAALVTTEKAGRVRTCRLAMRALEEEAAWIERHRQLWSARFDELDKIVEHLKSKEKADARRKRR